MLFPPASKQRSTFSDAFPGFTRGREDLLLGCGNAKVELEPTAQLQAERLAAKSHWCLWRSEGNSEIV